MHPIRPLCRNYYLAASMCVLFTGIAVFAEVPRINVVRLGVNNNEGEHFRSTLSSDLPTTSQLRILMRGDATLDVRVKSFDAVKVEAKLKEATGISSLANYAEEISSMTLTTKHAHGCPVMFGVGFRSEDDRMTLIAICTMLLEFEEIENPTPLDIARQRQAYSVVDTLYGIFAGKISVGPTPTPSVQKGPKVGKKPNSGRGPAKGNMKKKGKNKGRVP